MTRRTKSILKNGSLAIIMLLTGALGYRLLYGANADTSALKPLADVQSNQVVGVGKSTTDLYKNVTDGSSFSSADDAASYVRGENAVAAPSHTVSYGTLPATSTVSKVTVNVRAEQGSASSAAVQVQLYNGSQLIGTGADHSLGPNYANFSDTFSTLSLKGAQLRTKVILKNKGTAGAARYTLIFIQTDSGATPTPTPSCPPGQTGTYPNCVTPPQPPTPTPSSNGVIRAGFYYPWFPETWGSNLSTPFTNYHPSLGFYNSSDTSVIAKHVAALQYANLNAGISSWWGQGLHQENTRFPAQLAAVKGTDFKWALYYEAEGNTVAGIAGSPNPTSTQITSDLRYIKSHYASDSNYLTKNGKAVIFAYGDSSDNCSMADRWKQANAAVGNSFYVVLKIFGGYQSCASQPDAWHQYAPASAESQQSGNAFEISPGFYKKGESAPRLARDVTRWKQNITDMVNSKEPFQLVTTFDEWGEGTAVESAQEWSSSSGYGAYIDALHALLPASSSQPGGGGGGGNGGGGGGSDPVLGVAGDIACDPTDPAFNGNDPKQCQMRATAKLLTAMNPTYVLTLGDNQYESGTLANFNASYDKSWGQFKAKTKPAIGNHEGGQGGSNAGYFDYFDGVGAQNGPTGPRSQGYYSYNVGKWHIVELNSNCGMYSFNGNSNGCVAGSPQEKWLKADLAANPTACTLAYWHVPRFTSGSSHYNNAALDIYYNTFWNDLYSAGVDIVLNGHDHDYERFQPLDPSGKIDPAHGITEFVVGTGGKTEYSFKQPTVTGSAVRGIGFGVLQLNLHANSYDWKFVPVSGTNITDSGTAQCHSSTTGPPPVVTIPTTPTGLTGTSTTASSVAFKWNASSSNGGVSSYNIYRNGNTVASVSGTTLSYTDSSVLPATTYSYRVSAVNTAGESGLSNTLSVTTASSGSTDKTPPTAPTGLTGTVISNSQVNLSWKPSTDNVGVAGYDVIRDGVTLIQGVQKMSYADNTTSAGHTYKYQVIAHDGAGNPSAAASVSVTIQGTQPPPPPGGGPCGLTTTAPARYKHVIWIWMENKSYNNVIHNAAAPYETALANNCGTDTLMHDAGSQYHSLPNYIAATTGLDSCAGGTACGGNSTATDCAFNAKTCLAPNNNIFRQVRVAGGTAKSFEEDMPINCDRQYTSGSYAARHNPAVYFTGSDDYAACLTDDVPMGTTSGGNFKDALTSDSSLPTFSFITPNVCNDTHNNGCTVDLGDKWLKSWVSLILASPAYQAHDTAIAIWQDEDTPIPNVIVAPSVKATILNDGSYSHYSLLRSTEEMLGLPTIGKASSAPSLRAPYNL